MKRFRLKHEYHDAWLESIRFTERDLTLVVDLDGHWNKKVEERAHLTFQDVKNMSDARDVLSATADDERIEPRCEILGIDKVDRNRYTVALTGAHISQSRTLEVVCRSIHEL